MCDGIRWSFVFQLQEAGKQEFSDFKDKRIQTSMPILDLLDALRPGKINYDVVESNPTTDEVSY